MSEGQEGSSLLFLSAHFPELSECGIKRKVAGGPEDTILTISCVRYPVVFVEVGPGPLLLLTLPLALGV